MNTTLFFSPCHVDRTLQLVPLSLAYLAQSIDNDCISIDGNIVPYYYSDEQILKHNLTEIKKTNPDILAISSWSYGIPFTIELIKKIKETNPEIKIILGGQNSTAFPEETLEITKADIIARGEGTATFKELINALKHNKELKKIKGISFKNNDKIIHTENREPADLNNMPLLDFSSFKKLNKEFYLITSFGCPYKCSFCSNHTFWPNFRFFPPEYIAKQIKLLQDIYGIKSIDFWDSNFTLNHKWTKKMCKLLKKNEISWYCYGRVDCFNKSLAKNMKKSGCDYIFFGIESLRKKTLQLYNKTEDVKKYLNSIPSSLKLTKKFGIKTILSFIIGSPIETKQELIENINEIKKLKANYTLESVELSQLTPEISSPLWQKIGKELEIFRLKKSKYAGRQLFDDQYCHPTLTPHKYIFKNNHLSNEEFEQTLETCYELIKP